MQNIYHSEDNIKPRQTVRSGFLFFASQDIQVCMNTHCIGKMTQTLHTAYNDLLPVHFVFGGNMWSALMEET